MHADGVGIGVETDQQQVNGRTAAEAVLNCRSEVQQSLVSGCRCQRIITAVGSTALMLRINGAEVVRDHLQIAGRLGGGIGRPGAITAVLCFDPAIDGVLNIEHGARMGAATHRAAGNPQGIGHGVSESTICTGAEIEQMKSTIEQELIKRLGTGLFGTAVERIVLEEVVTEQPM